MKTEVNIGDVFYKIEPTDHKYYTRKCRVCEGKKELFINGVLFACPMCNKEQETLRVRGFVVKRYRVYAIEKYINNSDWKYNYEEPRTKYKLYHKSGKGHYSFNSNHKTTEVRDYMFSGKCYHFNCPDPNEYSVDNCLYSDYKLAVQVANRLTQKQGDKVREYNEENGTDYELPVFDIEHDKKST